MKQAVRVLVILGMITGFYYFFPLIVGGIALSRIKKCRPGPGLSVCEILFGGLIFGIVAGILMLVSRNGDYTSCYLPADVPANDNGYRTVAANRRFIYSADGLQIVYTICGRSICQGQSRRRTYWIAAKSDDGSATPIRLAGSNGPVAFMICSSTQQNNLSVLTYDRRGEKALEYKYFVAGDMICAAQDGMPVYRIGPLM
ncbi:MAG: hypothetical protein LUD50_07090 [Clostridia bacterium]|nr:hypothetical protein [Clostridia bacterium]